MKGAGWVVRVIGDGTDKSHYQIIPVCEEPGSESEELTCARGKTARKFKRNGATVWKYRAQARLQKKVEHKWVRNDNSYAKQESADGSW